VLVRLPGAGYCQGSPVARKSAENLKRLTPRGDQEKAIEATTPGSRLPCSNFFGNLLDKVSQEITVSHILLNVAERSLPCCSSRHRLPPPQIINRGFRFVRLVLGLLLLVAAGLKAHGLTTDPLSQDSFLASPLLQVAVIEVELLLGLWLLSGRSVRAAWAATLMFFVILSGVSLYQALTGQESCGCLGRVAMSPWWAFILDITACLALVLWRPTHTRPDSGLDTSNAGNGLKSFLIRSVAGAILLGGGILLFAVAEHGSVHAFVASLQGEALLVRPNTIQLGNQAADTQKVVNIAIRNMTERKVRIIGSQSSCSPCVVATDLPIVAAKKQEAQVKLRVNFRGPERALRGQVVLFTDCPEKPYIRLRYFGTVKLPSSDH